MHGRPATEVVDGVATLHDSGTACGQSDSELLEQFLRGRGAVAEAGFAALVARHGPMVHRVCRGVLREANDADDAFQATFLILARKAGSIRQRGSIASWLYGVARRAALRARSQRLRRHQHEITAGAMAMQHEEQNGEADLSQEVQDEVDRLAARYRSAVILCDLEGLTHEQAARELGIPVGTVKVRLSRARQRLRERLLRRGLAPALLGLGVGARGSSWISAPLVDSTVAAAMQIAAGQAATVSLPVALLVQGVNRAMVLAKVKLGVALLTGCLPLFLVVGLIVHAVSGASRSGPLPAISAATPNQRDAPQDAKGAAPEARNIEAVRKMTFVPLIRADATLEPRQSVAISSSVSGTIKQVLVDLGDRVKKGKLLLEIDAPELADDLEEARALVALEEARVRQVESHIGKKGETATTEADRQLAVAQLKVAQVRLHKLENRMAAYRLTSPLDGVVSRRNAHVGEVVRGDSGMELLNVSDLSRLQADAFVSEDDIRQLDQVARVVFRSEGRTERETTGRVVRKAVNKEATGDLGIVLEFENSEDRIRPGQKGVVTMEFAARTGVLAIPVQAIFRERDNGTAECYRVVDGRAVRTEIKLGDSGHEATRVTFAEGANAAAPRLKHVEVFEGARVEVRDGLKEGDRVLWNPGQMKEGQRVDPLR
jgi:RND family efflux transporter MFP subunit